MRKAPCIIKMKGVEKERSDPKIKKKKKDVIPTMGAGF